MIIVYIFLVFLLGIGIGFISTKRATLMYRHRWKEALTAWMKERDGTAALEKVGPPKKVITKGQVDYHDLDGEARYNIAVLRYNKGLTIEDTGDKWESYKYWRTLLLKLKLKQEREGE